MQRKKWGGGEREPRSWAFLLRKMGVTLGWGSGVLAAFVCFFSLCQQDWNLWQQQMRAGNGDSWQRQKEHKRRTERVREARRKKTVERVKDKRSRWLTKRRSRRVDREVAPVSNTCSPDRLYRSEALQYTENQPVCPHTDLLLFCTWRPRIVLTDVLSSHSHYKPGSLWHGRCVTTRGRDGAVGGRLGTGPFIAPCQRWHLARGLVDALISSPRCERCSGLDNKGHRMTGRTELLSGLIKPWQHNNTTRQMIFKAFLKSIFQFN